MLFIVALNVWLNAVPPPAQCLVTASGARVRSAPSDKGAVVGTLPLGTVLDVTQTTQVEGSTWQHVSARTPRVDGWLTASLTTPWAEAKAESILLEVARARLAAEHAPWADDQDAVAFLDRTLRRPTLADDVRAELALLRLLLLQRALSFRDRPNPPAEALVEKWAKATPDARVGDDAGNWMVLPSSFWALYEASRSTTVAQRIAFEAVRAPAGECEGIPECVLGQLARNEGRYLLEYPGSAHAAEVCGRIARMVGTLRESRSSEELLPPGVADRLVAPLETALAPVEPATKADAQKAIASLRAWVRANQPKVLRR